MQSALAGVGEKHLLLVLKLEAQRSGTLKHRAHKEGQERGHRIETGVRPGLSQAQELENH